jgi:hypothetical protein
MKGTAMITPDKAIGYLQKVLARKYGTGIDTTTGAGVLFIGHDRVTLVDPRHQVVARGKDDAVKKLKEK